MKANAIKCPKCKDVLFSRTRHDFRWCSCGSVAVDGGFNYMKVSFKDECPQSLEIEVNESKEELHKDWSSGSDKYGIIKEDMSCKTTR